MADGVTKDPMFTTEADIARENDRRRVAMETFWSKLSAEAIRPLIMTALDPGVGRVITPGSGETLYVEGRWLIRGDDKLKWARLGGSDADVKEREAILRRGSDHLRASVGRAADWAGVPAALLAAVLQNENSPKASYVTRRLQSVERDTQSFFGRGSTGFGNVRPETLEDVKAKFKQYYKRSVLGPGVKDALQNDNAETDIYHAAAVLRDGLNKAWSAGPRSLNAHLGKVFTYFPYFAGIVASDVAIRAMGHYNGMGDGAKTYGEAGLSRIKKQTLYFHPPK